MNKNFNFYGFCKKNLRQIQQQRRRPCLLLCAISYKQNFSIFLPGIEKDVENIENMCKILNIQLVKLVEDEVCIESISEYMYTYEPIVIWFCGHGILNKQTNSNEYILSKGIKSWPINYSKITDLQFEKLFTSYHSSLSSSSSSSNNKSISNQLIVFDVCHSATFLNLNYFFYEGRFLKKIDSIHPFVKTNQSTLLIVISAATDFSTTQEDSRKGGYLTNKLVSYLLDSNGYYSLKTLDTLRPSSTDKTHNLIISINKKENIYITHSIII